MIQDQNLEFNSEKTPDSNWKATVTSCVVLSLTKPKRKKIRTLSHFLIPKTNETSNEEHGPRTESHTTASSF